jgi:hypothetical protein
MNNGVRIAKVRCGLSCVEQRIYHCSESDAATAWNGRPVSSQQGAAVYQMRHKAGGIWTECDADGETCIKRMPHWADAYEFRTLYVGAAKAPAAQAVDARYIPNAECKQGQCARPTVGCWGKCSLANSDAPVVIVSPAAAPADLREGFDAAFLSWNGFHTKAELDREWAEPSLSGIMFRAGALTASPASTPEAAPEQPLMKPEAWAHRTQFTWEEVQQVARAHAQQPAAGERERFDEAMQAKHGGPLTKEDLDACWSELPGYAWRRTVAAAPTAGAATTSETPSAKQAKLRALADRIDHEKLWRRPMMYRDRLTDDQRDRLDAGCMLRRYSDLLAPGRWLVLPPTGNVQFSAGTLEKVTEMAKADQDRRAAQQEQSHVQ